MPAYGSPRDGATMQSGCEFQASLQNRSRTLSLQIILESAPSSAHFDCCSSSSLRGRAAAVAAAGLAVAAPAPGGLAAGGAEAAGGVAGDCGRPGGALPLDACACGPLARGGRPGASAAVLVSAPSGGRSETGGKGAVRAAGPEALPFPAGEPKAPAFPGCEREAPAFPAGESCSRLPAGMSERGRLPA